VSSKPRRKPLGVRMREIFDRHALRSPTLGTIHRCFACARPGANPKITYPDFDAARDAAREILATDRKITAIHMHRCNQDPTRFHHTKKKPEGPSQQGFTITRGA
jgi:hypothetical protein